MAGTRVTDRLTDPRGAISGGHAMVFAGPATARFLLPDIMGISGDLIFLIIVIVIISIMAYLIMRFLNQSIDMATQLEKEINYTRDLELANDELAEEVEYLQDRVSALEGYAQDHTYQYGSPSEEYGDHAVSGRNYGSDVVAYQHYEEVPEDGEFESSPMIEVPEEGETGKRERPVVAKAKAVAIKDKDEPGPEEEDFNIQDVFVIYKDGRLMTHLSKKVRIIDDSEIIGSMITAVQMCVRESFRRESRGSLDELKFSDLTILMENGELMNLAVVLTGKRYGRLQRVMRETLDTIHRTWGDELEEWDGTLAEMASLEKVIKRDLLERFDTETFHKDESKALDLSQAGLYHPE